MLGGGLSSIFALENDEAPKPTKQNITPFITIAANPGNGDVKTLPHMNTLFKLLCLFFFVTLLFIGCALATVA